MKTLINQSAPSVYLKRALTWHCRHHLFVCYFIDSNSYVPLPNNHGFSLSEVIPSIGRSLGVRVRYLFSSFEISVDNVSCYGGLYGVSQMWLPSDECSVVNNTTFPFQHIKKDVRPGKSGKRIQFNDQSSII